ncbi:PEP-CTERM sorting domain-containing protein [Nostoc sp. CMAA1605]|uniref:PEP-CTERM sorting domain-containing protein n=1 Tax=Nostoc sp. CMAA1605 TaxID=2055159 RepID=UPI001F2A691D|nr:PEP-CTERM sorting domain-containing protein [Nostoc sp. CMAA1605]MCF4967945.1 hypothetical protein [Nostoc sp. CMAA1605]
MMKHTSVLSALLLGASIAVGANASPANAITTAICQVTDVTYTSGSNDISATACRGELETDSTAWPYNNDVTGNGDPLLSKLNTLFGTSYNWTLVRKDEASGNQGVFDGFDDAKTGTWSSNSISGPFAISLKAGTGFSVYLFENITQAVTNGKWSTVGILNNGGKQPNLSHLSLFTAQLPTQPVPEPITMLGLGVGTVGLGVLKRKYGKKEAKAKVAV